MSAPLANSQKRYLSQLSDRAFNFLGAKARGNGEVWPPADIVEQAKRGKREDEKTSTSPIPSSPAPAFPSSAPSASAAREAFRHAEVAKACGKVGLRCCSQDDYGAVKAHFQALLGETGRAFNTHVKAQTNPERVAEWKLHEEIRLAAPYGITVGYVERICRAKYKCCILEASAKQKWALIFDVKRTVKSRRNSPSPGGEGSRVRADRKHQSGNNTETTNAAAA